MCKVTQQVHDLRLYQNTDLLVLHSVSPHLYYRAISEARSKADPGFSRKGTERGMGCQKLGTDNGLVFQIEIPIVDYHICREAYAPLKKKVTRDMICAGEKEGESRCLPTAPATSQGGHPAQQWQPCRPWSCWQVEQRRKGRNEAGDREEDHERKVTSEESVLSEEFPYFPRVLNLRFLKSPRQEQA